MIHSSPKDRGETGRPLRRSTGSAIALLSLAVVGLVLTSTTSGCSRESSLEELAEAQRLSADLLVEFTKGSDAANRAVMADTDDASAAFARQAEQAAQGVQRNADALKPLLLDLGYAEESRLLEDFGRLFDEYRRPGSDHPRLGGREYQHQGAATLVRGRSRFGGCASGRPSRPLCLRATHPISGGLEPSP